MALFKDIPVGEVFRLGHISTRYHPDILWRKVSDEYVLITNSIQSMRYCVGETTNFYPETNVHRWLADENGLMQYFEESEKRILQKFRIVCNVPRSKRKQYGRRHEEEVFASLPSIDQMRISRYKFPLDWQAEASDFAYQHRYDGVPTRSASGEKSLYIKSWSGDLHHIGAESFISVHPILCFDRYSEWELDPNNHWTLVEPVLAVQDADLISILNF